MADFAYITSTDVENYTGTQLTANGEAAFNLLAPAIQDLCDSYLNRTFNFQNPIIEHFNVTTDNMPPQVQSSFFTKNPISLTPYNVAYPQAGGIRQVNVGKVNGAGGTNLDLTYIFNFKTHFKFWNWYIMSTLFNPMGYLAVEVTYNSDDAQNVPKPVKLALVQWISRMIQESSDSGKSTSEVMTGNIRVYYNKETKNEIPDFVKMVLNSYRIYAQDHF